MREQLKGAAPYVSVFGLILLLAGAAVTFLPTVPQNVALGLAVAGGLLMLAWPVLAWDDFKGLLGSRQARFGSNALLLALAVIAILVAAYFLGTRYYYVQDFTANRQFTLQRQTLQILDGLRDKAMPVQLTAVLPLSEPPNTEADLRRLAERYSQRYGQVALTVLRPQADPVAAQALAARLGKQINELPGRGLIAEAGGKNATVFAFDEQAVTEAIVKATRPTETTVYFTTGHGEPGPDSTANGTGYSTMRRALEQEGYKVETVSLATMTETLKVGNVVVVAGAKQAFQPNEVDRLQQYVEGGGGVLLLLDPGVNVGLEPLMLPWEIRPHDDLVLDPAGAQAFGQPTWVPLQGDAYDFHTITKDLSGFLSVIPSSRSLGTGTPVTTSLVASSLIKSGPAAWGETDLAGLQTEGAQPAQGPDDNAGPVTLGVAAEGGADYGRLVVYGSSLFVADAFLQQLGNIANGDLFLNSVNWLAADEDLISIRPTEPDSREMSPPQNPPVLWWALVVILPLAVLLVGLWIWRRRR